MSTLRYTLLSDGSSDRMLMPVIDWLLYQHCSNLSIESNWADLARLPLPPKTLPDRVVTALDLYPCDILFIHRDAERESFEARFQQIAVALEGLATPPVVCVIPVRMQEAWLMFDESALRKAAGNPRGKAALNIPKARVVESLPDPKELLFDLLRTASELKGTRLKRLNPGKCAHVLAQTIADFSPLRALPAFRSLEEQLKQTIASQVG